MNAHLSIKAIAAAAALALSGVASASTLEGEELFFSAWNGNPDAASSIVINLNMTTSDFRANADDPFVLGGSSLATLNTWLSSLAPADLANVRWNVTGAALGPQNSPTYGLLTTSTDITTRNPEGWGQFTGLDGAVGNYPLFFTDVNSNLASTDAFFGANALQLFSPNFNGGVGVTTLGSLGSALGFYAMFADQDGNEFFEGDFATLAGTWALNFTGGVASLVYSGAPVPLPAAVWLLGSALVGLMGISRRKAA